MCARTDVGTENCKSPAHARRTYTVATLSLYGCWILDSDRSGIPEIILLLTEEILIGCRQSVTLE